MSNVLLSNILLLLICFSATSFAENSFPKDGIIAADNSWAIVLNSQEGDFSDFTYISNSGAKLNQNLAGSFGRYSGFKVQKEKSEIKIFAPGIVKGIKGIYLIVISKGGKYKIDLYSDFAQFLATAKNADISKLDTDLASEPLKDWVKKIVKNPENYIFEWEVEHCELKATNPVCVDLHIRHKGRSTNVEGYDIQLYIVVGSFDAGVTKQPEIWSIRASRVKNYKWYDMQQLKILSDLIGYTEA